MKQRVAFLATCLLLLLCVAFLFVCASTARDKLNATALEELDRVCRLSATGLDSAAFTDEETAAYLRNVATHMNATVGLYAGDGALLFSNRATQQDALASGEIADAVRGVRTTFQREQASTRQPSLYALTPLGDGRLLCLSRPAYALAEAMQGPRIFTRLFLLAVAVATIGYAILQWSIIRTNRLVDSVQKVLEDFSDGNFDSRIHDARGDSISQAAHFNEVIGRIQDRVFKQKTRNQALNTVMNHIKNGILAVDDQMNVILVTPTAKQLLGIAGSPEGLPVSQASKDVKLEGVLQEAMRQEGVYTNEVAARTSGGRGHRPIRLYVSPMMKDGVAVGAVAIVEDITELRRLEQVRTDFAANVSHELKTPLTSIKGFVETLQNGAIDNPDMARKFLKIIMLEADRLTRLINDILSITKLESGKDEVATEPIRLDRMMMNVVEMLEIHAGEKQVTLHARHSDEAVYVIGNPDRTEQMLINLVENAIKYNKPGGSVTVSLFASEETVNLTVADTGIGIAEEHLPRLFERFYRVDKGRSRSMGGTGLGLAIVSHIVRTMDGLIEVHSKLDEGTEFLITLPRAPKPAEDEAADEEFA